MIYTFGARLAPGSTVEEKEIRNGNYPKFMKNDADPQDVVIVLGVYVLIISIIRLFLHWAVVWADQMSSERLNEAAARKRTKTRCA